MFRDLHEYTGNDVSVAVIDAGIIENSALAQNLRANYEVTNLLKVRKYKEDAFRISSHGTNCAEIIVKIAPNIKLFGIKVMNMKERGNVKKLLAAIKWAVENNMDIINISIGTINLDNRKIMETINQFANKTIIVAAGNNRDIYTYPASLSNVIGVKVDKQHKLKCGEIAFIPKALNGLDIEVASDVSLNLDISEIKEQIFSNSYAAPYVTGIICRIIQKYKKKDFRFIIGKLIEYTGLCNINDLLKQRSWRKIDWANNIILVEPNSKLKTLVKEVYGKKRIAYIKKNKLTKDLYILGKNKKNTFLIDNLFWEENNLIFSKFNKHKFNLIFLGNSSMKEQLIKIEGKIWMPLYSELFWDDYFESHQIQIAENESSKVLIIHHNEIELIRILLKLNKIFFQNGYLSVSGCNIKYAPIFDMDYIIASKDNYLKNYLNEVNQFYNPDIIFFGLSTYKLKDKFESNFDLALIFHPNDKIEFIKVENGKKKNSEIDFFKKGLCNFESTFQDLYKRIYDELVLYLS